MFKLKNVNGLKMTSGKCKVCKKFCHCIECEGGCSFCGNDDLMNGFTDMDFEAPKVCSIDPKDFE